MNFSGKLTAKIVIKDDYVRSNGTSALYLQVFINGDKKKFPLHISVKPVDFDKIKQRVKPKNNFHKDFNLIIEKTLADINKIEVNYRLSNMTLSMNSLIEEYENPTSKIDFIKFWETEMINQKNILKIGTYNQQMSTLNKLKRYSPVLYFYEITDVYFSKIKMHFKNVDKNSDNTITSFVKSFKKYLHLANKRGVVTPLNFTEIKNKHFKSERSFLDFEELNKLKNYFDSEFINATHKSILARFLFSCFSGLRISDVQSMNKDNFIGEYIIFTTTKTSKIQRVKLSETARTFIDPINIFTGKFSDAYINRELKFIAKVCGIKKNISFHLARHTFATNFLICGGRVEVLQKILGHSKITETMIYVHIVESISNEQIDNMDSIFTKK